MQRYNTKTMFIHIPKTAGMSLIKSIYGDVSFSGHRNFYVNKIALDIKHEKYFLLDLFVILMIDYIQYICSCKRAG